LSLPNSIKRRKGLNTCGFTTSRIDEDDPCWEAGNCGANAGKRPGWCHEADTAGERELATRYGSTAFPTLVVSHNKIRAGQFHCSRTSKVTGKCHCVCSVHKPCCSREDRFVQGAKVLRGNVFEDVETKQDCCNMCSNHPLCSAWEYSAAKTCSLMHVAAHAVPGVEVMLVNKDPSSGAPKSWVGARAGVKCASATKFY
jgi:hypothetical protein